MTDSYPTQRRDVRAQRLRPVARYGRRIVTLVLVGGLVSTMATSHIVPPETFHPAAESYRRLTFFLNLNPIPWDLVEADVEVLAGQVAQLSSSRGESYHGANLERIQRLQARDEASFDERRGTARAVFEDSSRVVAELVAGHLDRAARHLSEYPVAARELETARLVWASFESEIQATDEAAFHRLGECWLELVGALGHPGVAGVGRRPPQDEIFRREAGEIRGYLDLNYGPAFTTKETSVLAPIPRLSPSFDDGAPVSLKLPPGSNLNKQIPRPRQVLNMAVRGVNERETPLIALGDMAFDSSYIFGEPARTLQISCNTCHNKSITNPQFFIPGLSLRPGSVDVSNSFFAPHANNGHFDPLDIPDLRGIRFTAPYGRNGRFASLREFVRNVIVHEFNGPEPDPLLLDGIIAYMNEFDFLPNPDLKPDGTLRATAPAAAKRGEKLFFRPFDRMGGRSCATCHIPSDSFLDRQRHDIGTVTGSEPGSLDRALDTPTLLSASYTAPYFHDGSQPTLAAVVAWFNRTFELALSRQEIADLTAYLETVGDGTEAYEDTVYTLDAELEEFSFFLSTYDYIKRMGNPGLMSLTFQTIATEIDAHKWDVRDASYLPVLDEMSELMQQAHKANLDDRRSDVEGYITQYWHLYENNVDHLK